MKKKFLALVLTLAMVLSLLPATALATGENEGETPSAGSTIYVDANSTKDGDGDGSKENPYKSLVRAVNGATSGDTIQLAEGTYTLYNGGANVLQKDLTFVGSGTDKTTWLIGPKVPNPAHFGTEYDGDYSFDVRGTAAKETVTFKNMTLQSGKADYLGFIGTDNTVVEGCVIEGKTFYWGYTSAEFRNTTFICPPGDYALWTYSSPVMTFDGCTFNSSGKVINVYTDYGAGNNDITVNFKDCTVNNSNSGIFSKQVLNINDSNMGNFKYRLNICGDITVSNVKCDKATCSRLFGFGGKAEDNNKGKTIVKFGDTVVWQDGEMVDQEAYHNEGVTVDGVSYNNGVDGANGSLYAEGYKDNAFKVTYGELTKNEDGTWIREGTKTCKYCGQVVTFKERKEADPIEWDVSKSKTATQLNTNTWTSDVTLSLPSAEENLATDVVLVLDASKCTKDMLQATIKLIENLEKQVKLGANIKVGIVMFKGNAVPFRTLEKAGDLKALRETFTSLIQSDDTDGEKTKAAVRAHVAKTYPDFMNGGTNVPSGLQLAKNMLEEDISVTDARKYVVLVSDGDTYLFCHKNDKNSGYDYTKAYTRAGPEKGYIGGVSEYNNYDIGVPVRNKYFKAQNSLDANLWQDYLNYVGEHNQNFTQYDFQASAEALNNGNEFPDGFTDDLLIPSNVTDRIINSDVSRYQTASLYTELQDKYNCYYYFLPGGYDQARTMLQAFTPADRLIDGTTTGTNIFSGITKDILYAVSAGSTVTDTIGKKFDFDGIKSLTVGGTELKSKADGNVTYFGDDASTLSDSNYRFKVDYDSAKDEFVWTIDENVSKFAPVQLTYTVKLTTPETDPGTYGTEDLKGEKDVPADKALFTNESAILNAINSAGAPVKEQAFPKPSVSYTVKNSHRPGGSGGGTVTIPDDVPTGLNGKDHYAYVVGYPDGMVYPQKNITRAEVATIFFRLLEDETREANMTKSNGYNDMKDGAWYTCAVSTLSKMGIIKGYEDGSFKPDASISRAEFAAIAARFDPDGDKTPATFSDVSSHWAKDEISIAANHGWIKGYEDGSFKPDQKITRAETMTLVNRVLKRLPETKDDLHKDMKTWPDNQNESAWFYLAVQEATNSHYQKLKKDGTHETWESMRETRDWAALEK